MKEKVMFTLSLACFIGVMWLSSIATKNVMPVISEDLITPYQESSTIEYIDDVYTFNDEDDTANISRIHSNPEK